jgi:hypothetical protein
MAEFARFLREIQFAADPALNALLSELILGAMVEEA